MMWRAARHGRGTRRGARRARGAERADRRGAQRQAKAAAQRFPRAVRETRTVCGWPFDRDVPRADLPGSVETSPIEASWKRRDNGWGARMANLDAFLMRRARLLTP